MIALGSRRLEVLWRQSTISTYLRCPRRFFLEFVQERNVDHSVNGFAAPAGTALHYALAMALQWINEGSDPDEEALRDWTADAFADALEDDQDNGRRYDPEKVEAAIAKLLGEQLEQLVQLVRDPRMRAIDWIGIEEPIGCKDRHGRSYSGTIDAVGIVKHTVEFGMNGYEPVTLYPGEVIVLDWKTGDNYPRSKAEREGNLQLGYYSRFLFTSSVYPQLQGRKVHLFIGALKDAARPKRPRDANGNTIKEKLPKQVSPAYAAAIGAPLESAASSNKRPRGIPKWLPQKINPAYTEACARPRGPVFRECSVDTALTAGTVRGVIRAAESGIYPAAGALNGTCAYCPFNTTCTQDEDTYDND